MNKRTIFFDVDGTLLGTKNRKAFCIPESTLEALRALKQNGHNIVICSGRPELFVHRFFPNLFTSFVALNGTHVICEGKTILDQPYPSEKVAELMAHFDSYGCSYNFIGKTNAWARRLPEDYLEKLNGLYGIPGYLRQEWQPEEIEANMMDFIFTDEEEFERCRPAFQDSMVLNRHPGQLAADLSFKEQDKSKGIQVFLDYAGIRKEDTMAFGDGYNDVTMMGAVGIGVAMGNAIDEVKQAADYVTSAIFDDGVYFALKHFGLI